ADVIVGFGFDDLAQSHDLALLVRNLEANHRLAGNDFHHAHADGGQGPGEILGQIADLADFHAGRRAQLEARDPATREYRNDFAFHAEIAQFELYQARHRLQRFIRVGLFAG